MRDIPQVTLSGLMEQLAKMPTLTAKQASAYICGPRTYAALKDAVQVKDVCENLTIAGVKIYVSDYALDNGKFYPADYLESKLEFPSRAKHATGRISGE